jgi:N-formylmaleamate deformylase
MSESTLSAARLADLASINATSHWVKVPGAILHVLDYGGTGAPCIVVPGITTPAICVDFTVRELVDVLRLIVLDVRGRGLSSRAASYRTSDYAADVEAVGSALGLEGALLMGHSMGARIAAAVATRGHMRLLGSLLVDPPTSGPGRGPYPTSLESFLEQLSAARSGTTADEMARFFPNWPRAELELRARWLATCDELAIRETHAAFEQEDFFAAWPAVPPPAALIYGSDSVVVTPSAAAEAARTNPSTELIEISQAGHMIPWDNLSGFISAVRSAVTRMLSTNLAVQATP